jgi:predicted XRE-type DNA-binding protein
MEKKENYSLKKETKLTKLTSSAEQTKFGQSQTTKDYSFPSEAELKEIRGKTSNPNYPYKNKILPANASAEEKFKYQICQAILVYQQENNLPVEEVAEKTGLSLNKTYDILLGRIKGFKLKELTNYLENLHVPYEVVVRSEKFGEIKQARK